MRTTTIHVFALAALTALAGVAVPACTDQAADGDDDPDTSMSESALSSNQKNAFNYFVNKGLTKRQAAGVVGNLIQESSVDPKAVEFGGGPGRGIAQWSVGGRWNTSHNDNMTWYASQHGLDRWTLNAQLAFVWYELTTFSGYGLASLKDATTITAAVKAFQDKFERCGTCDASKRIQYANQVFDAFGGTTGHSCYSGTLKKTMPDNACVQSKFDGLWYQCDDGDWVDRWTDPEPCNGVHPL